MSTMELTDSYLSVLFQMDMYAENNSENIVSVNFSLQTQYLKALYYVDFTHEI